jgi:hypothetical protein
LKRFSRRWQSNGGFGPDSGPYQGTRFRAAFRPTEASKAAVRYVRNTSTPAISFAQIADNSGLPGERAKSTRGGNLSKAETRHKAQTGSDYTAVCGGKELLKDALHFSLDSDRYEYSVDGSRFEIQL